MFNPCLVFELPGKYSIIWISKKCFKSIHYLGCNSQLFTHIFEDIYFIRFQHSLFQTKISFFIFCLAFGRFFSYSKASSDFISHFPSSVIRLNLTLMFSICSLQLGLFFVLTTKHSDLLQFMVSFSSRSSLLHHPRNIEFLFVYLPLAKCHLHVLF